MKNHRTSTGRCGWILLVGAVLLSGAYSSRAASEDAANHPKLVALLVINQFWYEFLQRFDPCFSAGGFRRPAGQGADFTSAHYGHVATFTGPGHTTIATGSHPNKHGILTNRYCNRATSATARSLDDAEATLIGGPALSPADDTSLGAPAPLPAHSPQSSAH